MGALAHELRSFDKLSVTPPGINTLQELAESPGIELDCLGGRLRSLSQSFVGPLAEAALERMTFDRVFLGADAAQLKKFRDTGVAVEVAAVASESRGTPGAGPTPVGTSR